MESWMNGATASLLWCTRCSRIMAAPHEDRLALEADRRNCGSRSPGYDPRATAKLLNERGRAWFPDAFEPGPRLHDAPALAHLFAGMVTLADQLGSDEEAFKYEANPDPHYIERARRIAAEAVASKKFGGAIGGRTPPLRMSERCSATSSRDRRSALWHRLRSIGGC